MTRDRYVLAAERTYWRRLFARRLTISEMEEISGMWRGSMYNRWKRLGIHPNKYRQQPGNAEWQALAS